jgi:hypothetical protein
MERRKFTFDSRRRIFKGGEMSVAKLELKRDDLQPIFYVSHVDRNDDPVNLTGATIRCTMKDEEGTKKINRQTAGITITDGAKGEFQYQWQSGDTDTPGLYYIEFEIEPATGGKFTIPSNSFETAQITIHESLDFSSSSSNSSSSSSSS